MERRTAHMIHFVFLQPISQITREIAWSVIAEQTRLVSNNRPVTARRRLRQFEGIRHIFSAHRRAQFPWDDIAAVIVQDRGQIIPTLTNDFEVGKIRLPHLVDSRRFVFELIRGFNHHIIGCCDQIRFLQNAISRWFRCRPTRRSRGHPHMKVNHITLWSVDLTSQPLLLSGFKSTLHSFVRSRCFGAC